MQRIRELLKRNEFGAALATAEALIATVPQNRDVLYMIAVSNRYLRRIPEALATLDRLERLHPTFSRLFQERGHCYVALRDAPRAIDAFLRAVNLNPALPASWSTLQTLFRMTGQAANAEMAAGHVATLARLPAEILTATAMFSEGDLVPAERIVRDYLLKHGNHVEGMRLLARIGLEMEVPDDAEVLRLNRGQMARDIGTLGIEKVIEGEVSAGSRELLRAALLSPRWQDRLKWLYFAAASPLAPRRQFEHYLGHSSFPRSFAAVLNPGAAEARPGVRR